jgi:hypothetical protein
MAYKVCIYEQVEEIIVRDEDEASQIAEDEERLRDRVTKIFEVPDSEFDKYD